MEGGIESGHSGQITDPDFRFELYLDWLSIRSRGSSFSAESFCKNKGIPFEALGMLVREFQSYDPTGERWGKLK
jgi:hypothetical protein|tara:strand:+ start:1049 stop:1270 length:222 start_codon:yes stop_codon:yes gene_type:complete